MFPFKVLIWTKWNLEFYNEYIETLYNFRMNSNVQNEQVTEWKVNESFKSTLVKGPVIRAFAVANDSFLTNDNTKQTLV